MGKDKSGIVIVAVHTFEKSMRARAAFVSYRPARQTEKKGFSMKAQEMKREYRFLKRREGEIVQPESRNKPAGLSLILMWRNSSKKSPGKKAMMSEKL